MEEVSGLVNSTVAALTECAFQTSLPEGSTRASQLSCPKQEEVKEGARRLFRVQPANPAQDFLELVTGQVESSSTGFLLS